MNVLIDTNVILDILLKREPYYTDASRIGVLCEMDYINGYISASAVTDVHYIASKEMSKRTVPAFTRSRTFSFSSHCTSFIVEILGRCCARY